MVEWQETTLGKLCEESGGDIQTGPFGSQLHAADYVSVGIPSIMPQNIGDNRISTDGIARINDTDAQRLSRYLVRAGDIVYSRRGDVERRALIRDEQNGWLCGTGCLRVRFGNKKQIDPTFMSHYLGDPVIRAWIVQHAVGATMPNLNTGILSNVPVLLPSYGEQKAIAAILGALDDKIELNRRMNATLEAMARALFKSWFVDFDPVLAKSEGRHPFGMDSETAALFCSRLVPSALGDIPDGWSMEKLGEVSRITIGRTPPRKEQECFVDSPLGTTWLSIRDMADGSVYAFKSSEDLSTESIEQYRVPVVPTNTVIVSFKLTVGRVALTGKPMTTNEAIAHIRIDESPIKSSLYLYCFMKQYDFTQLASTSSIATAVNSESIRGMKILLPDEQVQNAFHNQVKDIFEKIRDNLLETEKLEKTRDYLLPKLISGDIRIPDAVKFVEAA